MYKLERTFIWLATLVAYTIVVFSSGCGNGYQDEGFPWWTENTNITVPTDMIGDINSQWNATWTGANGPFNVVWDFGGGAEPNTVTISEAGNSMVTTVRMVNPSATDDANYTVTVTVTDSKDHTLTGETSYTVVPAIDEPTISSTELDADSHTLIATATADPRALPITFSLIPPNENTADSQAITVTQEPLEAIFEFEANDGLVIGASGTVTLLVEDSFGGSASTTINVSMVTGITFAPNTIYAIPLSNTVGVGETVTVVVATGELANPFQFLSNVGVTIDDGARYVNGSMNCGSLGGNSDEPDGIWADMGITSFLMSADSFIMPPEGLLCGIDGRHRHDFRLTPLQGTNLTNVSGALYNFELRFYSAGTYTLGFIEEFVSSNLTYYSDNDNNNYTWGTLMAGPDGVLNIEGVSNTIVVTE